MRLAKMCRVAEAGKKTRNDTKKNRRDTPEKSKQGLNLAVSP
jgi:hypothetical protein